MKYSSNLLILLFTVLFTGAAKAQYGFNVKRTISESHHQIIAASYSNDGSFILTAGSDSNLIVWNSDRKTIFRTLTGLRARPNAAAITPDNKFLFSGGRDNIVSVWDLTSVQSKIIKTFEGHTGAIKSLDISPDGRLLATGSADKTLRIWDIRTANLIYELKGHTSDVNSVLFSPDGKTLASGGGDGSINTWNIVNGSKLVTRNAHKGWIRDMEFSPDGKVLASGGDDRKINLWEMPGLTLARSLEGHRDRVQTISFSPDYKSLLSGSWDRTIILWDIASGKPLLQSEKQKQVVISVDFCPFQPDFISSCYESEALETWVVSGIDESQWKKAVAVKAIRTDAETTKPVTDAGTDESMTKNPAVNDLSAGISMIEIFSPQVTGGKVTNDKNSILLVGRVFDSTGISGFIINGKPVKFSDAGVFQYTLNLRKGENNIDLTAINRKMKMDERLLTVVCTAEDAATEEEENASEISKGRYYALLIGVNEYDDPNITDLDKPVEDAESLYNVLVSKYTFEKENIIFLKNPSYSELFTAFEELEKKLTINDNLLIFYAGHGDWDEKGRIGYWFPSDATKGSSVKWFRNSSLRDFISSIQARHTVLIADACFSGAIFKTRAAFEESSPAIQKLYELPSRKAMTSGILEEVPDESMFMKYLVKRLDENEDQYMPSEVLFNSFKMAVMSNSPNVPQYGTIQNVGDEGGDFIFIRK